MIFRLLAPLLLAAVIAGPSWAAWAQETPTAVIERLNTTLIDVMRQATRLGYQGRLERLEPVLKATFNYPLMARVSVSKHWAGLTTDQKRQLSNEFARLSSATFASRFNGFSGERFEIVEQKEQRRNSILVETRLVKPSGESVPINYLLRQFDGKWRIVDVYLDAKFSELAIKRSEFTSVVARSGFDSLIALIEDRIAELASTS